MNDDIKKLGEIVKRKQEGRDRDESLREWLYGRQNEIKNAPHLANHSFFCDACERDFDGVGVKVVRIPKGSVWFAYYVGICPCGAHAIRRITDKLSDPYYLKSEKIRREQGMFHDDMLEPAHPRFRQLYPKQYARLFLKEKGLQI